MTGALDSWRVRILGMLLLVYLGITGVLAYYRLFWNDELFTVYIARIPSVSGIWAFLATGVEQTPPTFHLLIRVLMLALGEHHMTVRLPSILAMGMVGICMFVVVSRRTSTAYGLIAMLCPILTQAFFYAYEARPYALVLAFSAGSLLCWQSATEGHRRGLSLAGLAATLAAALGSHYYAVLAFLPLVAGEVARSFSRRRVDPAVWLAFCVATTPLLAFLPLLMAGRKLAGTFWARPRWQYMVGFYQNILSPAVRPAPRHRPRTGLLCPGPRRRRPGADAPGHAAAARHEVLAAVAYLALPVVAILLAKLVTGAFTDRYALPAVLGLGHDRLVGSLSSPRRSGHDGRAAGCPAGRLVCGIRRHRTGSAAAAGRQRSARGLPLPADRRSGEHADRDRRPSCLLPADLLRPPGARPTPRVPGRSGRGAALSRYRHGGPRDARIRALDHTPGRAIPSYLSAHPHFLLYADRGPWAWLLSALGATSTGWGSWPSMEALRSFSSIPAPIRVRCTLRSPTPAPGGLTRTYGRGGGSPGRVRSAAYVSTHRGSLGDTTRKPSSSNASTPANLRAVGRLGFARGRPLQPCPVRSILSPPPTLDSGPSAPPLRPSQMPRERIVEQGTGEIRDGRVRGLVKSHERNETPVRRISDALVRPFSVPKIDFRIPPACILMAGFAGAPKRYTCVSTIEVS